MMFKLRTLSIVALLALLSSFQATPVFAQSDLIINQRQPAVCPPGSATPYAYYNVGDGKWHCTATAPVAVLGGAVSSTTGHTVAGFTDPTSTASGTTQNTEYTLNSVTVPANAFNANSRGLQCTAWGTGAANANAKNYKFYFGGTAVVTVTGSTDNAKDYLAKIVILRTGASTQAGYGEITSDIGAPDAFAVTTSLAITDTADITVAFKSANTAAAAASATGKGMSCVFLN